MPITIENSFFSGFWLCLVLAMFCQAVGMFIMVIRMNWKQAVKEVHGVKIGLY